MKKTVLVVFGDSLPAKTAGWSHQYDTVVAKGHLGASVEATGVSFAPIEPLVGAGSIYEASALLEELSQVKLADGTQVTKSVFYKGYELWWIHYDSLYYYFCLPYTQHKNLLEYLKDFQSVDFYNAPYKSLFSHYLRAHDRRVTILNGKGAAGSYALPFGVLLQIILTVLFLPALILGRDRLLLYTGDKLEKDKDYDIRMKFIYKELREKRLPFVECIRSLESWKIVLQHAWVRRRPVVYAEAVAFIGRFLSVVSGGRRPSRLFDPQRSVSQTPEALFKLSVATQYLRTASDDIWAIRVMQWILRAASVRAAFIPAATERNFHTVLGCKLNAIPTAGIMHGVASRYGTLYDFLPGFDGEKSLSVDVYGVWSAWWKKYYIENGKAYTAGQLQVSGPMRPLEQGVAAFAAPFLDKDNPVKVLFVSEQLGVPEETLPYLRALLEAKNVSLYFKFRSYRDGFEQWLNEHEPEILRNMDTVKILRGSMSETIAVCDVVVGSHSTGVLETLQQLRVPIFFQTKKWGDYYTLKDYGDGQPFFAQNPQELLNKIQQAHAVSAGVLEELRERYFGDPHKNGSAWVVEELQKFL